MLRFIAVSYFKVNNLIKKMFYLIETYYEVNATSYKS